MVEIPSLIACWDLTKSSEPCSELQCMRLPLLSLYCWFARIGIPPRIGTASEDSDGVLGAWLEELPELGSPSPCCSIVSTYKSLVMARSSLGALALVIRCSTCLKCAPQMSLMVIWCLCLSSLFHNLVSVGEGSLFVQCGGLCGAAMAHALAYPALPQKNHAHSLVDHWLVKPRATYVFWLSGNVEPDDTPPWSVRVGLWPAAGSPWRQTHSGACCEPRISSPWK